MSELGSLQRALAEALRASRSMLEAPEHVALAERLASGSERLSPAMQLDIYRQQFFLRHLEVLRDDFRSLAHLAGEDGFEALATAYLAAHPPSSFSLRDLGARLPAFVADTAPWSNDPFVADLARTEWAFVEAFDAPDAPRLDVAAIAAIPEDAWPSVRIVFQPSLQRLALGHPAHEYRLAVRQAATELVRPPPRPAHVIVFRGPGALQVLEVEADAFALIEALAHGVLLGDACERVAGDADLEAQIGAWFHQWTTLGWVSRVV